jgi:hypothetical protein
MKEAARPTPQEVIRRHVETAADWEWREMAAELYTWTDRFNDRFFTRRMPDALLSFQRLDYRILAAYTLRRNPQGLLYEITLNVKHLDRPLWAVLETLMHEYLHLWQQNEGQQPVDRNYHNREFVNAAEVLGLHPAIGSGAHLRPADGLFADFLRAYGVPEPQAVEPKRDERDRPLDWWADPEKRRRKRKRSRLRRWSCGCQTVRVGTEAFHAQCLRCGRPFRPLKKGSQGAHDPQWEQAPIAWPAPEPDEEERAHNPAEPTPPPAVPPNEGH